MLRGRGGAGVPGALAAGSVVAVGGRGASGQFSVCPGRAAGLYGDGAHDLVAALCGRPSGQWHRRGPVAAEVATIAPVDATVWSVLAGVAAQFMHRSPTTAAATAAAAAELGDLRGRVVSTLPVSDRRCLALAEAALVGSPLLVLPRADESLSPREVAVVATAIVRCATELGVGVVFDVTATRNAFWADDVWHVGAGGEAEHLSTSACAHESAPGTVIGWVGGTGSG